jgi:hypothetical protein
VLKSDVAVGWVAQQLIDHTAHLIHGTRHLRLWVGETADPVGSCYENVLQLNPPLLTVAFNGKNDGQTIVYPKNKPTEHKEVKPLSAEAETRLAEILALGMCSVRAIGTSTVSRQWAHSESTPRAMTCCRPIVGFDRGAQDHLVGISASHCQEGSDVAQVLTGRAMGQPQASHRSSSTIEYLEYSTADRGFGGRL